MVANTTGRNAINVVTIEPATSTSSDILGVERASREDGRCANDTPNDTAKRLPIKRV
jgi:hypothetical protein